MRGRAQLDAIFEYMRPDEHDRLLADEHAEEAKKSDRGRCRRPTLASPYTTPTTRPRRTEIR